jgi:hypothetical protein
MNARSFMVTATVVHGFVCRPDNTPFSRIEPAPVSKTRFFLLTIICLFAIRENAMISCHHAFYRPSVIPAAGISPPVTAPSPTLSLSRTHAVLKLMYRDDNTFLNRRARIIDGEKSKARAMDETRILSRCSSRRCRRECSSFEIRSRSAATPKENLIHRSRKIIITNC